MCITNETQLQLLKPVRRGHSDRDVDIHDCDFLRQRYCVNEHPSAAHTNLKYTANVSRRPTATLFGICERYERANPLKPSEGLVNALALVDTVKPLFYPANFTIGPQGRPRRALQHLA